VITSRQVTRAEEESSGGRPPVRCGEETSSEWVASGMIIRSPMETGGLVPDLRIMRPSGKKMGAASVCKHTDRGAGATRQVTAV